MLEWVAAGFLLVNVYLAARQNMWTWPIGVVGVSLYFYVFAEAKLYSDAGLQVFYLAMQFYGWYRWARGGVDHTRSLAAIRRLTPRAWALTWVGAAAWTAGAGTILHRHTDAAAPYPDSFNAVLSVIAQFLLTWKFFENWTLWIVVDVVSIFVYAYKGLWPTTALYAAFLVVCVQGYREWRATLTAAGNSA